MELLPVSIGEALDKLTILEIKLGNIKDERRKDVEYEYNLLKEKLDKYLTKNSLFHYNILKEINNNIWDMQDTFRESNNDEEKTSLCKKIIEENDRRFMVKKKINTLFTSSIQEQKGYTKKTAFVCGHVGLGDLINCIGVFRYLSTIYDNVIVVAKESNYMSFKKFIEDDKNIQFFIIKEFREFGPNYHPMAAEAFYKIIQNPNFYFGVNELDVYLAGEHNESPNVDKVPFCFYYGFGLPFHYFWTYFHVNQNKDSEELYKNINHTYVLIHSFTSEGRAFSPELVEKTLNISRNDILFIDINNNVYEPGHKWYELAEIFVNRPIADYKDLIENAPYLFLSDSSLFCFAIQLNLNKAIKCYYCPRYYKADYSYFFTDELIDNMNSYKKFNWKVFEKVINN